MPANIRMAAQLSNRDFPGGMCLRWWAVVLAILGGLGVAAGAAINPRDIVSIHSRSDQFIITAIAPGTTSYQRTRPDFRYDPNAWHLEAPALAVTCERVKNALLQELGAADKWNGRIYITLRPAATVGPNVMISSTQYADGWQYRMEIPDQTQPDRLIRGLVQVLLLEMGNRRAGSRSVEIPIWLMEGFTTHLLNADGPGLILQTQKLEDLTATKFPAMKITDPFKAARERLGPETTMSFADLCLPSQGQLNGPAWETYRYNSQILVTDLLQFRDGKACMQEFIAQLPNYLNHQLAFLQAFQPHFHSLLEVEKWWSVSLVNFTGRDPHMKWTPFVCLQRLDEILRAPVEIRANTNTLPTKTDLRLQNMFEKLDYTRQKLALQSIANQLQQLEWNAPPDVFKLVRDYHTTLISYLQRRAATTSDTRDGSPAAKLIIRDTIKQLDRLDVIRDDFRNFDTTAATAQK